MKTFQVPKSIALTVPGNKAQPIVREDETPHEVTFKEFATTSVLADPRWVKDFAHVLAAMHFSEQLDGETIAMEEGEYLKLKECVEKPTNGFQGWHPAILPQLVPFMQAILEAK